MGCEPHAAHWPPSRVSSVLPPAADCRPSLSPPSAGCRWEARRLGEWRREECDPYVAGRQEWRLGSVRALLSFHGRHPSCRRRLWSGRTSASGQRMAKRDRSCSSVELVDGVAWSDAESSAVALLGGGRGSPSETCSNEPSTFVWHLALAQQPATCDPKFSSAPSAATR